MLFCVAMLTSCEDATEIIQVGELNEQVAFQNLDDIKSGLSGVYANYGPDFGGNDAGVDAIYFNEIFTDNVKAGIDNNGQGDLTYAFQLQPGSDTPLTIWSNRYATINAANRILRAIDNINFSNSELVEVDHIKGQLLAIRALAHLDLFQYYTVDYQAGNDLSIINMDFVPSIEDEFERNTVSQTITFINNDLDNADLLIDDALATSSGVFFVSRDFVKAVRARLALCTGNYTLANSMATQLVNDYPLANPGQYISMFADGDDTEVIFELSRVADDSQVGGLWYFNNVAVDGGAYIEMSNELFNLFDPMDIRSSVNVNPASVFNGVDDPSNILLINKYPSSADGPLTNDIKVFRSSEMLLIRAETEARNNQLVDAANSILELRTARYFAPPAPLAFSSVNEALTEILKERRLELCFEGHRYLDLKRLGGELGIGVDRNAVDCASFSSPTCNLSANDYRFTLPIPTSEIEGNSLISQNPNY